MPKAHFNRAAIEAIFKERMDIAEAKGNDYGGRADNIEIGGVHGLAIRLMDKALRLVSLTTPGQEQKVKDESIRQTFLDTGNYADFGVSILDGTWGVKPAEVEGSPIASCPKCKIIMSVSTPKIDSAAAWGAVFESMAHVSPPAGVSKTAWIPKPLQEKTLALHNRKVKARADARAAKDSKGKPKKK